MDQVHGSELSDFILGTHTVMLYDDGVAIGDANNLARELLGNLR